MPKRKVLKKIPRFASEAAERLVAGAISRSRCGERPTLEELRAGALSRGRPVY